jgi:hypothetical protein
MMMDFRRFVPHCHWLIGSVWKEAKRAKMWHQWMLLRLFFALLFSLPRSFELKEFLKGMEKIL